METMTALGITIICVTAAVLVMEFFRHRRFPLPAYGWAGIAILAAAEGLMFRHLEPVATYFTPIAWSAYILLADAAVRALTGHSRLRDTPAEFITMAVLSIPLWLIFEAYNLRLQNWTYVGLPANRALALVGYGWSFATITPGILETADLVEAFGWFLPAACLRFSSRAQAIMVLFGVACLVVPLVLPRATAAFMFALVWVGFIFLLDPINYRLNLPSILGDFAAGRRSRFYSLLIAGFVCGWFWEFWNYWAAAKWHYIFPMFQQLKIFEMPAPGYLGFLPFAAECFVMCVTASWLVSRPAASALNTRLPGPSRDR
ncbi:MAG TPA: hypothetical protein VGR48_16540 [Terriglobales bacterium]|nr:hypothetical protein [Terriglobales bacterium]